MPTVVQALADVGNVTAISGAENNTGAVISLFIPLLIFIGFYFFISFFRVRTTQQLQMGLFICGEIIQMVFLV